MGRLLNELNPTFRPKADALLARFTESELMVMIVCTGRTQAEQDAAVASGHSKVAHSRHQDGMAIDVCPFDVYMLHGADKLKWDGTDPVWKRIGEIGKLDLSLRWGGDFHPLNAVGVGWDPGHFEVPA